MRLLGILLAVACCFAPLVGEEASGPIQLHNARCIDGQKVDAALDPVLVRVDNVTYAIRVSSRENAEAIRKMKPGEALRAVVAFNRELADRLPKP
jgi:hypothetical protein